jgi:hypothetical protein
LPPIDCPPSVRVPYPRTGKIKQPGREGSSADDVFAASQKQRSCLDQKVQLPAVEGAGGSTCNGFKTKVVLVTGAASGTAEATARRFSSEGARVALIEQPPQA